LGKVIGAQYYAVDLISNNNLLLVYFLFELFFALISYFDYIGHLRYIMDTNDVASIQNTGSDSSSSSENAIFRDFFASCFTDKPFARRSSE
jgi:hypothetical protein